MDLKEYEKIKGLSYLQYCDYLQNKYGIGSYDYMTKSWNKNPKVSRTKEGLVVHHKFEDHAKLLSHPEYAKQYPFEWQTSKNLIYCDYLEHLLLHILICEAQIGKVDSCLKVYGLGGIIEFIVPELNDVYSGWKTREAWRINCYNLIINDKEVYLSLIKRIKKFCCTMQDFKERYLFTSFNEKFGTWSTKKNENIINEIKML